MACEPHPVVFSSAPERFSNQEKTLSRKHHGRKNSATASGERNTKVVPTRPGNPLCKLPMEILVHIIRRCTSYQDLKNFLKAWPAARDAFTYPGMKQYWAHKGLIQKFWSLHRDPNLWPPLRRKNFIFVREDMPVAAGEQHKFLKRELYASSTPSKGHLINLGETLKRLQYELHQAVVHCAELTGGVAELKETLFYVYERPVVMNAVAGTQLFIWTYVDGSRRTLLPDDLDDMWTEDFANTELKKTRAGLAPLDNFFHP